VNIVESVAAIFSFIQVILIIKNSIWNWPIGVISSSFYIALFYQNHIWGNTILQVIFIIQSFLCWYNWNKKSYQPISWLKSNYRLPFIISTGIVIFIIFEFLRYCGGTSPILDSITTGLCIMAMCLLAFKKIDNWILWITADIIFIIFFYLSGLYILSGSYVIFLTLATTGFLKWSKNV
jgi:nicotinamide mononucleotide transporter